MSYTIQKNVSLKSFNTFGIEVNAERYVRVQTKEELVDVLNDFRGESLFFLGGGSNVLFTRDVTDLVVYLDIQGKELESEDDDFYYVRAHAGEPWHEFVLWTLENNWNGLENLSLIPGNVGTAPMQNIGAYGVELKDVCASVEYIDVMTGGFGRFEKEECQFGYRNSIFKQQKGKYVITSVLFALPKVWSPRMSYGAISSELKTETPTAKEISNAVISIRSSKLPDPKEIGNAGSFFKNPIIENESFEKIKEQYPDAPVYEVDSEQVKIPAGWLIETAGWKGKTVGNCGVHPKQALVLVNHGDATGQEIIDLARLIQSDIEKKFGIKLQMEVNVY